ncbi:hypothetical protein KO465_00155 [Candidatus Micrarchaeota archaeon]|nr:hypothetical protein [Candidatus Micrarchaeota archaeon]
MMPRVANGGIERTREKLEKDNKHPKVIGKILDSRDIVKVFEVLGHHPLVQTPNGVKAREASVYFRSEEKAKEFERRGIISKHTQERPYIFEIHTPKKDIVMFSKDEKILLSEFEKMVEESEDHKTRMKEISQHLIEPYISRILQDLPVEAVIGVGGVFNKNAYINPEFTDIDYIILFDESKSETDYGPRLGQRSFNVAWEIARKLRDMLWRFDTKVIENVGYGNSWAPYTIWDGGHTGYFLEFSLIPIGLFMEMWKYRVEETRLPYDVENFSQSQIISDPVKIGEEFKRIMIGQ